MATNFANTLTGPNVSIFGKALVMTVEETQGYPCGPPVTRPPKPPSPNHEFWGLRPGKTEFQLEKKDALANRIKRINPVSEVPEMEHPVFFVFNEKKPAMTVAACKNNNSYRNFVFAFAIHELTDPHDSTKKGPHALVLLPAWIDKPDPGFNNAQFYLLVAAIVDDPLKCNSEPSPPLKEGCHALRELADMQPTAPPLDFALAIWDRIDVIRPVLDHNYAQPSPPFHNGIIHGNF
jgi:hypothetical protein